MNWLKRHDLAVFLVLAFALSWFVWPFVLLDPESTLMIPYGPFIAVFIVLALTRGWAGVRNLLASMVRWRVGLQWYAVALFLPVAIVLVARSTLLPSLVARPQRQRPSPAGTPFP